MPQENSQETTNVSYLTAEAGSGCLLPEEDYLQWQTEAIPWLLVAGSIKIVIILKQKISKIKEIAKKKINQAIQLRKFGRNISQIWESDHISF